eukprot:7048863-Lingulodinium_polyedra.AAC.1
MAIVICFRFETRTLPYRALAPSLATSGQDPISQNAQNRSVDKQTSLTTVFRMPRALPSLKTPRTCWATPSN